MYKQLLYTTYSYQKLSNKLNAQLEFTLEGFYLEKVFAQNNQAYH